MEKGTPVRFVGGPYGVVAHLDSSRFEPEVVTDGDTGRYFGPHPNPNLDGWHIISVNLGGRDLFVPLYPGCFEAVDA
jgi:hypothetical protein